MPVEQVTLQGGDGPLAPAASMSTVSTMGTLHTWQVPVTSTAKSLLPAWVTGTAYALGQAVTNDGGKVYRCTQAGTSGTPIGGPTGTDADIGDGTVRWRYVTSSATFKGGCIVRASNANTVSVFYGGSSVTSSSGAELPPGQMDPLLMSTPASVFAIVAATASVITVAGYQ